MVGILVIIAVFIFQNSNSSNSNKNLIVTSFYPLYFFTSSIVGDRFELYNVTPAGVEPHDYDLTAGDRTKIEKSKLVIINGGRFELWGEDLILMSELKSKIVNSSEGLISENILEDGIKGPDPHVWLSPRLAKKQAEKIYLAISQIDPQNNDYYKNNYDELSRKFDELDVDFKEGLNNCKQRNLVTSHIAFNYLAKDYNLKQVSISGVSPDEEPSAADLAWVAEFARRNGVKYIFFESLVSPRFSETIAREIGAQTLVLNPLEGLTGEELKRGDDYFSKMRENLNNLKIALECQ